MGYSHHAVQDLALMRIMPNTLIAAPGDPVEVVSCLEYLAANPQPSYLRLGKTGEKTFHSAPPALFPGKWVKVVGSKSSDNVILSTGATLNIAMEMVLQEKYQDYSVYTLPLWSMACKSSQPEQVARFSNVITRESFARRRIRLVAYGVT